MIAVEPAGLVELAHAVHVPPTTLGAPQESAAHEHAVIAVEPARLTALLPQETQAPLVAASFQKFAGHAAAGSRHDAVAASQLVPAPQSAEETGQRVAGSSPLATQQQRRGPPLDDAAHVEAALLWAKQDG